MKTRIYAAPAVKGLKIADSTSYQAIQSRNMITEKSLKLQYT